MKYLLLMKKISTSKDTVRCLMQVLMQRLYYTSVSFFLCNLGLIKTTEFFVPEANTLSDFINKIFKF